MPVPRFLLGPSDECYRFSSGWTVLHFRAAAFETLRWLVKITGSPERRGFEAGGLLLSSDSSDFRVDLVDRVAVDHRFFSPDGFSEADLDRYQRAITEMRQLPGVRIVGHFRSHREGEAGIAPADFAIAALIGETELMLLVERSQSEAGQARLYRRSSKGYDELMTFSLDAPLPEDPPVKAAIGRAVSAAALDVNEPELPQIPAVRDPFRAWRPRKKTWGLLGLLALAVPAAYWVSNKTPRVGMAERTASPVGKTAAPAPRAELPVFVLPEVVVKMPRDPRKRPEVVVSSPRDPGGSLAGPPTNSDENRLAVRAFRAPLLAAPRRGEVSELERAPALGLAPGAALGPAAISPNLLPVPSAGPSTIPVAIPAPTSLVPVNYAAAVAVRKTNPVISESLRSLIVEPLSVEVRVKIDSEGKVTAAAAVNMLNATQNLLAPSAVQAAMLWRFTPARRNGQPVNSESVLKFDFARRPH